MDMSGLNFTSMGETEFQIFRSWFVDEELRRRISLPDRHWLDYVRYEARVYAWLVYEDGVPVGQVQLDVDATQSGYVGMAVNPGFRRQGYCKRILRALLLRPKVLSLVSIEAGAEMDNVPSQRCLLAVSEEPDEDGFLQFTYPVHYG
jgi:predicted acetyltransferase